MVLPAAGLVVALALCELLLRLFGVAYPNFYRWDFQLGAALRPGVSGWWTREGRANIRINSRGLRDREHELDKPAGVYRIAILGDSYAEAFQVPMERTFWSVLEGELQGCDHLAGRTVEVINFGVSGYGTAQELLTFRHHARRYDPDLVLLAFLPGNDLRNNLRRLEGDPLRPYFVVHEDRLMLDQAFQEHPAFLRRHSRLYRLYDFTARHSRLLQLINEVRARRQARELASALAEAGGEVGLDDRIFSPPTDRVWRTAWDVSERLTDRVRLEAQAAGARFLLVTIPSAIRVDPDPAEREAFMRRLGVDDLAYPEDRLDAFAAERGFEVLHLGPTFVTAAETRQVDLRRREPRSGAHAGGERACRALRR